MKINEVEAAVGVTKKNIRFYEEEGLISPRREPGNGYRSYSEADVERLRRIKLLRKLLDVPLLVVLFGIPAGCIIGTLKVLVDRLKEIGKGEEDAYRNY